MERQVEPNVVTCSAAVSAYETGGQWSTAMELLRSMYRMRVDPNVYSYSAAVSACEKGGQWQAALELL
eukprot:7809280-Alexandrium_andersonii.AAC.1